MIWMDEIILEISGNCNLDCIMCGYGRSKTKEKKLMSREMFEHVIEHYCEDIRTLRLNACGESTVHPEFKELLSYARQALPDVDIKLFSNINYRDPSISKAMADADVQLIMSLDSVNRDRIGIIRRGSDYDTIMRNFDYLSRNLKLKAVMFTLQTRNFDELMEVGRFSLDHDCHFFCNMVNGEPHLSELESLLMNENNLTKLRTEFEELHHLAISKRLRAFLPDHVGTVHIPANETDGLMLKTTGQGHCNRFRSELCIHYDGTVTPCGMFNPYVYGNVMDYTRESLLESERYRLFQNNQANDDYCKNCGCMLVQEL